MIYLANKLPSTPIPVVAETSAASEANSMAFKKCLADKRSCQGSFVKMRAGTIHRIENCSGPNCGHLTMSLESIEIRMMMQTPWLPDAVEWVALSTDQSLWEKAAVDYERQFVAKK